MTPAATVKILLHGLDLAVDTTNAGLFERTRKVLVEGTYDSDLGTDLPLKEVVTFEIADTDYLTGVA